MKRSHQRLDTDIAGGIACVHHFENVAQTRARQGTGRAESHRMEGGCFVECRHHNRMEVTPCGYCTSPPGQTLCISSVKYLIPVRKYKGECDNLKNENLISGTGATTSFYIC